jgi:hypothetical protein
MSEINCLQFGLWLNCSEAGSFGHNPPIYDFAAYDFWLKPHGMLGVAGQLRPIADLRLFDYMDRLHPGFDPAIRAKTDVFGTGPYPLKKIRTPAAMKDIPRYFRRFGLPRQIFQECLINNAPFDAVLIQTTMTYWYLGYKEVIDDIRQSCPQAKIVLGGFYATACPDHANTLGADVVISGDDCSMGILPMKGNPVASRSIIASPSHGLEGRATLPAWELYPALQTATIKLTRGCPFQCSYCYVPQSGQQFQTRPLDECLAELDQLVTLGVTNIAFYDDALLFGAEKILLPFMQSVIDRNIRVNFHTPNALHARYMTADIAKTMVAAGTQTFYLGFESRSETFQDQTGSKVVSDDLANAVEYLRSAGADPQNITAYEMLGHPRADVQQLESSMHFVHSLGIRIHLSDFSPIPGTPDGDLCRQYTDLDEPLNHSKTAFPIRFLGFDKVNYYKDLCRKLNREL